MTFTPLRFQSALAAGGLALMPFVLMQFTFPRQGKLISLEDLSGRYDLAAIFLLVVMLVSTVLHFYLIAKMSREFGQWSLLQNIDCTLFFSRHEAKSEGAGCHFWHDAVLKANIIKPAK